MTTMIESEAYGTIEPKTLDLYDRLTRGVSVALDVYADAERARRTAEGAGEYDYPAGPPGSIEVDAVIGLAVDLLRGAGDERTAWLLVELKALRGGPPRKLMEAIIALRTLHPGGPPPLVETARKAAGARVGGRLPRPTIEPMRGPDWLIRKGDSVAFRNRPGPVMEVKALDLANEPQQAFCHASGPDLWVDRWLPLDGLVRVDERNGGSS